MASPLAPVRVLLVGSAEAVQEAARAAGIDSRLRVVRDAADASFDRGVLTVLDQGQLAPERVCFGQPGAEVGRAVVAWWDSAVALARTGRVGAVVKGPVSKEVIQLGCGALPPEDPTWLLLVTGTPLRVAHLSDHVPLTEALAHITEAHVLDFLHIVDASLRAWGIATPRIAVAGVNPHAQGREEHEAIAPAVRRAQSKGMQVHGPVSPDTVFRQGVEGEYDCIVAHYHDQGHIAVKTWKFDGNCALNLGSPFLRLSVPHGPAYDIAGRGTADSRSMLEALRTAASLAAGRGFPATT